MSWQARSNADVALRGKRPALQPRLPSRGGSRGLSGQPSSRGDSARKIQPSAPQGRAQRHADGSQSTSRQQGTLRATVPLQTLQSRLSYSQARARQRQISAKPKSTGGEQVAPHKAARVPAAPLSEQLPESLRRRLWTALAAAALGTRAMPLPPQE